MSKIPAKVPAQLTCEQDFEAILAEQKRIMMEQDKSLTLVANGVDHLNCKAHEISDELDLQNKILNDLEYKVGVTTWKLKRATRECENLTKPMPITSWIFGGIGRLFF